MPESELLKTPGRLLMLGKSDCVVGCMELLVGRLGTPSETERLNYWLLRTVANKMYQQIQFRIMDMAI